MSNLVNLELNNNDLKEVGPNDFPYLQKLQTLYVLCFYLFFTVNFRFLSNTRFFTEI